MFEGQLLIASVYGTLYLGFVLWALDALRADSRGSGWLPEVADE